MSSWVLSLLVPCLVTCVWLCLVLVPPLLLLLKQDFKKKKAREPFACLPECSEWERDRCRAWPAGRLWAALRLWTGHWESFFFYSRKKKKTGLFGLGSSSFRSTWNVYIKKKYYFLFTGSLSRGKNRSDTMQVERMVGKSHSRYNFSYFLQCFHYTNWISILIIG